jgi:hypothetical protein
MFICQHIATPPVLYCVKYDLRLRVYCSANPNVSFAPERGERRRPCTVTNAIVASTPAASPRPTSSQPLSITPSVKMRRVIEPQVSEISSSDQDIRQMYVFEILY